MDWYIDRSGPVLRRGSPEGPAVYTLTRECGGFYSPAPGEVLAANALYVPPPTASPPTYDPVIPLLKEDLISGDPLRQKAALDELSWKPALVKEQLIQDLVSAIQIGMAPSQQKLCINVLRKLNATDALKELKATGLGNGG